MILPGGICLGIVLAGAAPTLSSACRLNECSSTAAAASCISALNANHSSDTANKFEDVSNKTRRHYSDGDLLYIEGHIDNIQGNIRERNELSYGDRRIELKLWGDKWIELNKTFKSLP